MPYGQTQEITLTEDVLDSRDIIARIEDLEDTIGTAKTECLEQYGDDENYEEALAAHMEQFEEEIAELAKLKELESEFSSYADWKGGETLINEDHFVDYVKQLLEDCGEIPANLPHYIVIDWEDTADNIRADYNEHMGYYMRA